MRPDFIRPSDRLPVEQYPEWLQMEVAEQRGANRLRWAIAAIPVAATIVAAISLIRS